MRVHETFRRVPQVYESRGSFADRFARRDQAARSGVSKTGGCESQSPRPETRHKTRKAKDGHAALRFPRPCLLEDGFRYFVLLRRKFSVGQSLADDLRTQQTEAVRIGNLLFLCRAVVEAERLLIHVTEQVERLNANVSSTQATLEQAPEVFNSVCVNLSTEVGRASCRERG